MFVAVLVGALALVLAVMVVVFLRPAFQRRPPNPPGWTNPPDDPTAGDLRVVRSTGSLHNFLLRQHGGGRHPVSSFWWRDKRVVTVCSPKAFKDTENLYNRPKLIFAPCFEPLHGSSSIQSINGTDWKQRKRLLHGTIRGRHLESFFSDFVCIAQESEERWSAFGRRIPLMTEMFRMVLKAILCSSLGNIFEDDSGIESLANTYHLCKCEMDQRVLDPLPPSKESLRERDFQKNLKCLNDTLKQMKNDRENRKKDKDLPLLDTLLTSEASEQCVLNDMVTFLGGFHTASYFMTWALTYLAQYPNIQETLYQEIEEQVGGECGDKLKAYALTSSSYMRQFLDEALRMSTTVSFSGHYSDHDVVVDGCYVPAKTPIIHAIGVMMMNEDVWEDPRCFNPDRFAPESKHAKRGLEFRPFGIPHVRRCPANQFVYFMASVYIAVLLHRFIFVPEDQEIREKSFGIASSPKGEIFVQVKLREHKNTM